MIKSFIHLLSFFFKEITEILRQPRLVISLILGPFLVLLLFGLTYNGNVPSFRVSVVVPPSFTSQQVSDLKESIETNFTLVSLDSDQNAAMERLRRGETDLVEVLPEDIQDNITQGRQSSVKFIYSEINPFDESWVKYLGTAQVNEMNRALLETAITNVQKESNSLSNLSPQTVVSPLTPEYSNLRGQSLDFVNFYAPGVLALILQHIAVTLGALSIVRERERGTLEMFRVAPVSSSSVIIGKYLGYSVFLALLAGALVAVLMLLGTPMLGNPWVLAGLLALLIVASLGIGFFVSCISNTDSTAVQISMLVLLVSIFFSGFFLPLDNFTPLMQKFTLLIPLTHGIQALQRIMLIGNAPLPIHWIMLGAITVVSYILVQILFRRQLKRL